MEHEIHLSLRELSPRPRMSIVSASSPHPNDFRHLLSMWSIQDMHLWAMGGRGMVSYFRFLKLLMASQLIMWFIALLFTTIAWHATTARQVLFWRFSRDATLVQSSWVIWAFLVILLHAVIAVVHYRRSIYLRDQMDPMVASVADPIELEQLRVQPISPSSSSSSTTSTLEIVPGLGLSLERFLLSGVGLLLIITTYCLVQYGMQYALGRKHLLHVTLVSILCSIAHLLFKRIWRLLCFGLTIWEHHTRIDTRRRSYYLKVFLFDWISYWAFYATRAWLISLPLEALEEQHLVFLITDLFTGNILEIAAALFYNWFWFRIPGWVATPAWNLAGKIATPERNHRVPFDLAEEYAELMLRQLVISLASLVWPTVAPALGVLLHALEFWVDRYKWLWLCDMTPLSDSDFRRLILLSQVMSALLVAIGMYPTAMLWLGG